jgi:hypothetical protein
MKKTTGEGGGEKLLFFRRRHLSTAPLAFGHIAFGLGLVIGRMIMPSLRLNTTSWHLEM